MLKKFILVSLLTAGVLVSFTSCSSETPEPDHALAGTWHFTTTPDASTDDPGDFSASQAYLTEITLFVTFEVYTGAATIDGASYSCSGSLVPSTNDASFSFSQSSDTDDDYLSFEGTLSGDVITGIYTGYGDYADGTSGTYSGTFSATK